MVGTSDETQWSANLNNLLHDTAYCYSIYGGPPNLLGGDTPPLFRAEIANRSKAAITFAVFGDLGTGRRDRGERGSGQPDVPDRVERRSVRGHHRRHGLSRRIAEELRRPPADGELDERDLRPLVLAGR